MNLALTDPHAPAPDITRPDTLETRRWCIVSTAHMTDHDRARLSQGHQPEAWHGETANGWTFYTLSQDDATPEEWEHSGFSQALHRNLRALHEAGFDRVEFDADALTVAGLEIPDA